MEVGDLGCQPTSEPARMGVLLCVAYCVSAMRVSPTGEVRGYVPAPFQSVRRSRG